MCLCGTSSLTLLFSLNNLFDMKMSERSCLSECDCVVQKGIVVGKEVVVREERGELLSEWSQRGAMYFVQSKNQSKNHLYS